MQDLHNKKRHSPKSSDIPLNGKSWSSKSLKRKFEEVCYVHSPKKKKLNVRSYLLDESPEKKFKPVDLSSDEEEDVESPVYVVTSGLTSSQLIILKNYCFDLGFHFEEMVTSRTTHLVTKVDAENKCKRTYKYMLALLNKSLIVNFKWLDLSYEVGRRFSEKSFEVVGDTYWSKPVSAVTLAKRNDTPIFDGCRIYCDLPFSKTFIGADELTSLLIKAGATIVDDLSAFSDYPFDDNFIIASPSDAHTKGKYENMFWDYNIPVVSAHWPIECVSHSKLVPIKQYLLTSKSVS